MATDACGNTATCAQVITAITDVTAPTITCLQILLYSAARLYLRADITSVTASDACGSVTVTHVGDQTSTSGCSQTIHKNLYGY
jgi:hypothetical protein